LSLAGRGDCAPGNGTYTVKGDLITFGPAAAGNFVFKWSYFRGQLTFQAVNATAQLNSFIFVTNPWRRVKWLWATSACRKSLSEGLVVAGRWGGDGPATGPE
jgi:hypothetical protein